MGTSARPSPIFDSYSIRFMLGLVASLGLMIGLVHLPTPETPDRVGWGSSPSNPIALQEVQSESASQEDVDQTKDAPPQTDTRSRQSSPDSASLAAREKDRTQQAQKKEEESTRRSRSDVRSISTLDPQAQTPEIVGGMGRLYLNIEYPEKARDQGIEGILELEFTVETDGSVSNVEVVESLHPLCDSAAVAGVRSVEFVPAKQGGDPIPVRMKLPVRFRLISTPAAPPTAGKNP